MKPYEGIHRGSSPISMSASALDRWRGREERMIVGLRVGIEDTYLVLEIQQVRLDNLQHDLIR